MIFYRKATESDLTAIAALHKVCFNGTFIASWDKSLIARYYFEYLKNDDMFILALDGPVLIGFCVGYKSGSEARKQFIYNNRVRLALNMLWLIVRFNKIAISKCKNYLTAKKDVTSCSVKPSADLLSICVKDEVKGRGVAHQLLIRFEELLREQGLLDYSLSVYKTNSRAIHFYYKEGLQIACETGEEYKLFKKLP